MSYAALMQAQKKAAAHVQRLLWLVERAVAGGQARPHLGPAGLGMLRQRPACWAAGAALAAQVGS